MVEPNGAGGDPNFTLYDYDAADRLVHVKMRDGGFTQHRTFTYDGRGFLLNETHPENDITWYRRYDARGNAGRKTNGPFVGQFDVGFTFDNAGRLTEVCEWEQGGCGRPLKEFFYGNGTSSSDRSKGKIKTAVRHNHVNLPGTSSPVTVTVEETYTYGGKGGRASLRLTELSTYQKFLQGWDYNDLGQVTSLFYPICQHTQTLAGGEAPLCTTEPNSRSVGFDYDLGSLTGIPGFASEINYHPNGMLAEIHHANGVEYGQGLDPHWMRRPASLYIFHPSNNLSFVDGDPDPPGTPHPYAYDGAGNIKSWSDWGYRYDGVSRVLEGAIEGGDGQSYEHDVMGNIRSITTERDGTPTTSTFVVDPNTNRLSGAVYDDVGNLLSRGPFTYSYDPLSMMQTMEGGGNNRTFIYTADDERIWSIEALTPGADWEETFTLRDLDGKVLRVFETESGQADLAWAQDYIYRDGQLLATARTDGAGGETHHHFHLNHLGTPLLITEPDGSTEALHSYFPFGEELNANSDTERMKFTGHERDLNQSGQVDDLDYMHARYYGPLMGRFLSVDRAGANPRAPQTLNRYAYVANNPLNYIDPTGLETECHTIPDEGGEEQVICADEITVEDEAPDVRADVIVEFELPVPILEQPAAHEFRLNLLERAVVDIPIDGVEYGRCVRENRLDYWQIIAGSAVPKRLVPPGRVPNPRQPLTTPASVTAHGITRAFPTSPKAARAASGLRVTGRAVSRVATPLTIAEGYYDIGVLSYCAFAD